MTEIRESTYTRARDLRAAVMTRRLHFSWHKFARWNWERQLPLQIGDKPRGLWYGLEGFGRGWLDYCMSRNWQLPRLANVYLVVTTWERIYTIDTLAEFHEFTELFGTKSGKIDWPAVREEGWCGFELSCPDASGIWVHMLDCLCGCIWDPEGLRSFKWINGHSGLTNDKENPDGR